jgi:ABC-type arginine/histidine transport system permease subunit
VKKVFTWASVAFVIFFVAFSPNNAAHVARIIGGGLVAVAHGFASFFSGLG